MEHDAPWLSSPQPTSAGAARTRVVRVLASEHVEGRALQDALDCLAMPHVRARTLAPALVGARYSLCLVFRGGDTLQCRWLRAGNDRAVYLLALGAVVRVAPSVARDAAVVLSC